MFGELSSCCCLPRLLNLLAAFSQPGNDLIEIPCTYEPCQHGCFGSDGDQVNLENCVHVSADQLLQGNSTQSVIFWKLG